MDRLMRQAKGWDVFFKIVFIVCIVLGGVFLALGIVLLFLDDSALAAGGFNYAYNGIMFRLLGEGQASALFLANSRVAGVVAFLFAAAGFGISLPAISTVRKILLPMKAGEPFRSGISRHFKTFGLLAIAYGVIANIAHFVSAQLLLNALSGIDESALLITVERSPDFTFFIVAAILFLLSYIFRYGEQLQQQADETL